MSRKNPLNNAAFQALTYSRLEVKTKPAENSQNIQDIRELRLPRFTNSVRGPGTKRKISSQERFKAVTFPLSAADPMATEDTAPFAAQKLGEQYRRQAEAEKHEILMAAREQAAEIMAAAEAEADKIKKEVEETAREEGLKAAGDEIESRISRLDELLKRLASIREYCRQKHEEEMVKLALSCTRRLINREISLDESVIADTVREVFNESSIQGSVTLLLNSDDFQLINEQRSQLLSDFPQIHELKIEVGEGIERGGCILESAMGRIDASLRSKFEELSRLLQPNSGP